MVVKLRFVLGVIAFLFLTGVIAYNTYYHTIQPTWFGDASALSSGAKYSVTDIGLFILDILLGFWIFKGIIDARTRGNS